MKVLIIIYYWPPAGGSGVQRWLKFVKYLQEFGIEPIVYCPENPSYPIIDTSLKNDIPNDIEVLTYKIFEPNQLLSSNRKQQSGGFLNPNPTFFGKFLQFIRANFFIPDARKFWVEPSVKFLENYISKNPIDAIITTGPPHSLHLIGLGLKKKTNCKWIADFRDPWTDIDYFHQLPLTKASLKKHYKLENDVLAAANKILVVGKSMKQKFVNYNIKCSVITNGFDNEVDSSAFPLTQKFSFVHVGLMNADRNPIVFWNVLEELIVEVEGFKEDLKITLIGSIADEVSKSLQVFDKELIEKVNYLPHNQVGKYQRSSQVLLLCINNVPTSNGIITGKIFEYLQAKRPILAIGPKNGDAAEIIKKTNSGKCFDFNDKEGVKNHVLKLYKLFKLGSLKIDSKNLMQYHRKELTKQLAKEIKETVSDR